MNASFIDKKILDAYGLKLEDLEVDTFGSGLINKTWKLQGNNQSYILQQINHQVFKSPENIADNLEKINLYLLKTAPNYLFAAPLPTLSGRFLVRDDDGRYFRLLPFVPKSHSINTVSQPSEAYEAAKQFGRFTRLLKDFDPKQLKATIPDFHNLELRHQEFKKAFEHTDFYRKDLAQKAIQSLEDQHAILDTYQQIVTEQLIPTRVIHHDTKINNVLFDEEENGLCVIDLDTIMPGYFLSDVGDMLRTYLSPASEEEQDFSKIIISTANYQAVYQGYMSEMQDILTSAEKQYFFYAGKMMIYMQAIRFLTDFLNGDVYYPISYENNNLVRAENQLVLLEKLILLEEKNGER